ELIWASGLRSPYPYLWWLPTRTLDPQLQVLDRVLGGPSAPTWLVVRTTDVSAWGRGGARTKRLVDARYHVAAFLVGHTIYLRDGVARPAPVLPAQLQATPAEHLPSPGVLGRRR
ncbi:MAG: hypothetical protein M3Y66_08280, partial [Actinomycetota bacterium]|nr:hypothetical protein [Actinomycetota bacterium]